MTDDNTDKEVDIFRCRYTDCPEGHPVAIDEEKITCDTCRNDLNLPPLSGRSYSTPERPR